MENIIKVRKKTRKSFQDKDWPSQYLEIIPCPLCKSNIYKKLYPSTYKRVAGCLSCGLIYTNPRLKNKYLKYLYSKEYFNNTESTHFGYEDYLADENKIVKTFSKRIDDIEKIAKNKGTLLDIGCATGFFMKAAKDKKWKVEGVEISDFAANYASKRFKFKIYKDDFLNLDLPKNHYDVVTLWDVIEHFNDPKKSLAGINKILKPGGLLVLSTPDVNSWPSKITRDKWVGYKLSDEHLAYFSDKTMKMLLLQTGFSMIKKKYIGKHVSLRMLSDRVSLYSSILGKGIYLICKLLPTNYFIYVNPFDIMCIYARKNSL